MEELFRKLVDLGYTETYIGNESVAAHIGVYYKKYGSLDGCSMVLESDRKPLAKWFKPAKISQDPFDWASLPVHASGVTYRYYGGCSG